MNEKNEKSIEALDSVSYIQQTNPENVIKLVCGII